MKIYVPTYDRGRKVQEIESTNARLIRNSAAALTRYTILYRGVLYNGENIYSTEKGAWADWDRDYKEAAAARLEHDAITWGRR